MQRLYFSGVVLPERALLSVSGYQAQVVRQDGSAYMTIQLNIWNNQVSAAVDTEEPDIFTTRNLVRREVELVTGIAGFILGHSYDVEITKVFGAELTPTYVFGVDIPVLAQRAQERDLGSLVNAIASMCFGGNAQYLRRCLADLAFAIKRPDDTAFYCFRAIESLRQSFGADLPEKEQWAAMARAVGSGKGEMTPLREHAFPARHGVPPPLSDADRQQHFLYTWSVVEKYIDYRLVQEGRAAVFASPVPPSRTTDEPPSAA